MTSLTSKPHHKILGSSLFTASDHPSAISTSRRASEAGYTVVALLAFMTLLAIFAMAAAPRIQQQVMREREKEAIFRGEEVADAIREYYLYRRTITGAPGDPSLPTSMDQLLEGIPVQGGSRNRQILRPSAAIDPLSADGEWRFIAPRGEALVQFQQSVMVFASNQLPTPRNQQMQQLQQLAAPQVVIISNLGTRPDRPSGTTAGDTSGGPFIGVASKNSSKSVLTYYGIETHDGWIFTPLFRN
jgi:type II secretory pathway pseudopilin PulG